MVISKSSSGTMIFPFYVISIFSQAIVTISSFADEFVVDGAGELDFTTPSQQVASSPVSGDPTVPIQGATDSFDSSAVLQGSNLWPPNNRFDGLSENPVNGGGEHLGLLFDGNSGESGIDFSVPSIPFNPIQLLNGVPEYIDNLRQWFRKPTEPNCRDGKHALCCQKPAPARRSRAGRPPIGNPDEYSQRRGACINCKYPFHCARFVSFKSFTPL